MTHAELTERTDAYLARIGVGDAQLRPTPETLARLHLAHLLTVPLENLSIHAGEAIQVDTGWSSGWK